MLADRGRRRADQLGQTGHRGLALQQRPQDLDPGRIGQQPKRLRRQAGLVGDRPTTLVGLGVVGAALGIVGNQLVARYKLKVGRRIHSAALVADAKHSWLDALSSAGALAGLGLVALGHGWGDAVAGFAVTLFILHVGWDVTRGMAHRLMDGVDPQDLQAARDAARQVDRVTVIGVRGRWMGRSLLLEIDAAVDPSWPLATAEQLSRQVETAVLDAVPAARQVRCTPHPHT